MQRITTPKQRQKLRAKAKAKELMSNPKWMDKATIADHINAKVTSLAQAKSLLKEMAEILIHIREAL